MPEPAGTGFNVLPIPVSTLDDLHPDEQRALCSIATAIVAGGLYTFLAPRISCSSAGRLYLDQIIQCSMQLKTSQSSVYSFDRTLPRILERYVLSDKSCSNTTSM